MSSNPARSASVPSGSESVPGDAREMGFVVIVTMNNYASPYFCRAKDTSQAIVSVIQRLADRGIAFRGGSIDAFVVENSTLDQARTPLDRSAAHERLLETLDEHDVEVDIEKDDALLDDLIDAVIQDKRT